MGICVREFQILFSCIVLGWVPQKQSPRQGFSWKSFVEGMLSGERNLEEHDLTGEEGYVRKSSPAD